MADTAGKEQGPTATQIEKGNLEYTKFDQADLHDKVLNAEARQATANEHSLSLGQALKTYKRAAFWSVRE
jgi:MFS transporter, SP family, general alpha glucoside:H+ symporter